MVKANRLLARACGLLLMGSSLSSCVDFNEDCSPLVDAPDQVVGWLAGDVDVTRARVRTGDNVIGQVVVDSYQRSLDDPTLANGTVPPQVGLENSGGIRSEGVCTNHEVLPRGSVRKKVLREVLPFDNTVTVLTVPVSALKDALEHAVAGFADASKQTVAAGTPSGQFLQIAGITVDVDCTQAAETATTPGSRIRRIVLQDRVSTDGGVPDAGPLSDPDAGEPDLDGGAEVPDAGPVVVDAGPVTSVRFAKAGDVLWEGRGTPARDLFVRVAMNSYLAGGGDGYRMFSGLDPTLAKPFVEQGLNFQIVARHFLKANPEKSPRPATPETRWTFTRCVR